MTRLRGNVFETTITTGTGAYVLAGAVAGARTFAAAFGASPIKVHYVVRPATEDGTWEEGIGTFDGVNQITRDTIVESSNANAAVNWGAGTKNIFCAPLGRRMVVLDDAVSGPAVMTATGKAVAEAASKAAGRAAIDASPVPRGHVFDLTMSRNGSDPNNDLDIAAGEAANENTGAASLRLLVLASAITKRSDAPWAVGSGNGGMDTGTKPNNGTLHVHLIERDTDGVVDALFSTSATSPTMPSGWTARCCIGAVLTDGSGNILPFVQDGDLFLKVVPTNDIADAGVATGSRTTATLAVPNGVAVEAILYGNLRNSLVTPTDVYVTSLDQNDETANPNVGRATLSSGQVAGYPVSGQIRVRTNTSRQIGYRGGAGAGVIGFYAACMGFVYPRGRVL